MSYIIKNNELIAETMQNYKNGASVEYAFDTSKEALNADIDFCLVNARCAKISNAKKWENQITDLATEVNEHNNKKTGCLQFVIDNDQ
jgi:hypothetical protein